ncbi:iron uptake transporter permease EfeU [Actinacidiphila bryophytorum]|uniref:High-affinity iron transporter n=1 Tax=Actinacidiphila bryophytorum TaxID=1436133 RepID=A0A9W4H3D9_9ACTN|nr:iron uptake transporter permease EfeU [Actinacidiphila bryophytorum]MBM9438104.1 FTR1 family protein [Actinacidiphila bryophytorum]MBN6543621.1 FTR1 family protein [Actinacidiphila bryophytorum]CAG7647375.1 High-affinity iron transporter [Actinacidiphila bryophytorum]
MWDDAFPSFLIGLREGLEAGLIVSILVATLVRAEAKSRLPQVWTGVLAAVALSMSFGAVLTFTAANLSATAQEAFGGTLSVVAVAFVTAMVFWMRRSARHLSGEIKQKVTAALAMGGGMMVLTSFLAVGREGLETALFLWTTGRAAGESSGPLLGAAIGLVIAAGLCWGLYRRVLKINLTRFFTATGVVLIVIASGVLGYGLRDLQEGGVLPGGSALAFDLSAHIDAGSWYAALLQGVLNLTPAMTWLQVAAYVSYLATVMTLFVHGVRQPAAQPKPAPAVKAESSEAAAEDATEVRPEPAAGTATPAGPAEPSGARGRPVWLVPAAVVAVPAVVAGLLVAFGDDKPAAAQTVAVSETDCGKGFTAPQPGRQTFQMHNTGTKASEVYLIDPASNAVYGEIEGLAPGTTRDLVATVGSGSYAWRCVPTGGKAVTSAAVRVKGGGTTKAVLPLAESELQAPLAAYRSYVDAGLAALQGQTAKLQADIARGDLAAARTDWLTAHRGYASLGAAYGTFADFDARIDGRKDGLPGGVADKDFTGFLRIEYGLWHGQSAAVLRPYADRLAADVTGLRKAFPTQDFDPADLPLRSHEILENTLQFELTGDTDEGSGSNLGTADANLAGTRELLTVLRPLLTPRAAPGQLAAIDAGVARLQGLLDAARHGGTWTPVEDLDPAARAKINGATGQLLEDLAPVPDLLEVRKSA